MPPLVLLCRSDQLRFHYPEKEKLSKKIADLAPGFDIPESQFLRKLLTDNYLI